MRRIKDTGTTDCENALGESRGRHRLLVDLPAAAINRMNQHSLEVLEFDLVRQALAARCGTAYAKEAARSLLPWDRPEAVAWEQGLTAEAKKLLEAGVGFEFASLGDLRPALRELSEQGAVMEPEELFSLKNHLRLARLLRTGIELRQDDYPRLWEIAQGLFTDRSLEEDIGRSFEPDGTVKDAASSTLQRIRRDKEQARERVLRKLEEIVSRSGEALQESLVTIRQGRYVVPVRAEQKTKFKGIVHDTSASGATAFMEPLATVELNNQLRQLEIDEQHEIERILRSFSARALENMASLGQNIELISRLDLISSRGQLALDWKAATPLISDGNYLKLIQARHPALSSPVPLDLELGDGRTTMVITGPNTGGKTVVLKTVGLLALMHQSGLQVPAQEGTALPVFEDVYADIGDEQSIAQSLSTFSSHITRLVEILKTAGPRSLVLLDEIGVGTEPGEGAALAMAVLEELTKRGCLLLSTTHYASLKAFVQEQAGMINAAMEYDRNKLRPTYRLLPGLPGSSFGLAMAEKLGLPRGLIERARSRLDSKSVRLEELLAYLETVKADLEKARAEAQDQERKASRLAQEYAEKLQGWRKQENEILSLARKEAEDILAQARSAAEQAVAVIRSQQASKESIKESRNILSRAGERAKDPGSGQETGPVDDGAIELSLGQEVFLPLTNSRAKVVALPDQAGRLKVQVGSVWMTVKRDQIQVLASSEQAQAMKTPVSFSHEDGFPPELHLLGMRAEEALERLDRYLDEAVLLGIDQVRIVHGKGTGALRKAVRQALSRDSRVKSFRLGYWNEGQDGVTIVELKP